MNRKYHVNLSESEREHLQKVQAERESPKSIRKRCSVLLMADESIGKIPTQEEIAKRCAVSDATVHQIIKQYDTQGLEHCLRRRHHETPPNPRIVSGEKEARIIALACGEPPKGYGRWTVRLLTERVIELQIMDTVSRETIRSVLKKHNLSRT